MEWDVTADAVADRPGKRATITGIKVADLPTPTACRKEGGCVML